MSQWYEADLAAITNTVYGSNRSTQSNNLGIRTIGVYNTNVSNTSLGSTNTASNTYNNTCLQTHSPLGGFGTFGPVFTI